MKQRICSVILCAVLALQPCMAEAAQGRAQAAEAAGRDDSPQVRLADETDGEAVNPGETEDFIEGAPIEPDDSWIQINGGVLDENTKWNLVNEGDEQKEKRKGNKREAGNGAKTAAGDLVEGSYGSSITYSIDLSTGTLTFSGSGDMDNMGGSEFFFFSLPGQDYYGNRRGRDHSHREFFFFRFSGAKDRSYAGGHKPYRRFCIQFLRKAGAGNDSVDCDDNRDGCFFALL